MLQDIRNNLQGTMAKVIIAIICVPFVLFGVESLLGGGGAQDPAEVNGVNITQQQLQEAIYLKKRQLVAQMGDNLDPAQLDDARLTGPALNGLINQTLSTQFAESLGMGISASQINAVITQDPNFQEDGVFSQDKFSQLLAMSGLSASSYKRLFTQELLLNQYAQALTNTQFLTEAEVDVDTLFTHATRDVRYILIDLETQKRQVSVSDEALLEYYEQNKSSFKSQEKVSLEYILVKQADFVEMPSDDEVKAAYEAEIAAIDVSEKREVAHILIESGDDAQAAVEAVSQALASGQSFEELVTQYSDDLGTKSSNGVLGVLDAAIFPAPLVDAANSLAEGAVSEPVQTDSGTHFVKLLRISETELPSFESRKPDLTAALAQSNAEPKFWGVVEELKDISFNAPDLAEPAEQLELSLESTGLLTQQGFEGVLSNPQIRAFAFSDEAIVEKINSDVIELADNQAIVVRVIAHEPEAVLDYAVVAAEVEQRVRLQRANEAMQALAQTTMEKLKSGESVASVAKSQGLEWALESAAKRNTPTTDANILKAVFDSAAPEAGQRTFVETSLVNGDLAVVEVSNSKAGGLQESQQFEKQMLLNFLAQNRANALIQAINASYKLTSDISVSQ